ncbi:MAG: glycosyltransferase, partial [Elusimicrobiota bacterium]
MTEERSKVSIIVIAYNEEKNIPACLESLAALDYPRESYEVVVVDNNSTDATRRIVEEFSARDPRFRLIVNPVRGIGATRNAGLRAALYDLAAYTDADCTVPPEWLSRLEAAFREACREDPKVAAAGGSSIAPENTTRFRQAVHVAVQNFWGNH